MSFFIFKWKHLFSWPGLIFAVPAWFVYQAAAAGSAWSAWPGVLLVVVGFLYVNYMGMKTRDFKRAYWEHTHQDLRDAISNAKSEVARIEAMIKPPKKLAEGAMLRFTTGDELEIAKVLAEICATSREIIARWQTKLESLTADVPRSFITSFIAPVKSIIDGYLSIPPELMTKESMLMVKDTLASVRDELKKQYNRMVFEDKVGFDSKVQTLKDTLGISSVIFELDTARSEAAQSAERKREGERG